MKKISLSYELSEIAYALEGAHVLIDLVVNESTETEHDARAAPRAASAITSLVCCRLRDLCRAMRGDLDPRLLATHFNESSGGPEPDLYLEERPSPSKRRTKT